MRLLIVEGYGVRLRVRGSQLVIESPKGRRVAPLADIDRVVIASGGASITSKALRILAKRGIDLLVLDGKGMPIVSLVPPWITATVDTSRGQYLAYADPQRALSIAKSFAVAKILNQASYVRYLAYVVGDRGLLKEAERIQEQVQHIYAVSGSLDDARKKVTGIEGTAARVYWGAIATQLPESAGFSGRDRDAEDPFNRCLNYLYGVLYAEVFRALAKHGLDPYAGFLHIDRSGKPVLSFDFIEMFRVSAVDSLLIEMFRKGFRAEVDDHGHLSRSTRSTLIQSFYRWLERRARDSVGESKKLIQHINSYALRLARCLRAGSQFTGFVERWWR